MVHGRLRETPGEPPLLLITQAAAYGICPRESRLGASRWATSVATLSTSRAMPFGPAMTVAGEEPVLSAFRICFFAKMPGAEDCGQAREQGGQFVLLREGEVVARARSLRSSAEAVEVWVETEPGHRRRGYGRQVCSVWARKQMALGLIAFYCYGWANAASRGLATSLGLVALADGAWRWR